MFYLRKPGNNDSLSGNQQKKKSCILCYHYLWLPVLGLKVLLGLPKLGHFTSDMSYNDSYMVIPVVTAVSVTIFPM